MTQMQEKNAVGETDDAPGAALLGFVLLVGAVVLAIRNVRRKA